MPDNHDGRTAWTRTYYQQARQLNTITLATEWHRLSHQLATEDITLTVEQAAAWASRGYLPTEAEPLIRSGVTPEMDNELERHAEEQAGGPEAHLRSRLMDLVDNGTVVLDDEAG